MKGMKFLCLHFTTPCKVDWPLIDCGNLTYHLSVSLVCLLLASEPPSSPGYYGCRWWCWDWKWEWLLMHWNHNLLFHLWHRTEDVSSSFPLPESDLDVSLGSECFASSCSVVWRFQTKAQNTALSSTFAMILSVHPRKYPQTCIIQ